LEYTGCLRKQQNVSERKTNDESYVRDLLDAVFNIKLEEGDVEKLY